MSGQPIEAVPPDLAPCEVEAVLRKARSMVRRGQIPRGDLEDVRQDLILALLAARAGFDSQAGEREAFAREVIRRAGAKIVRARRAAKRNPARVTSLEAAATQVGAAVSSQRHHVGPVDLMLDVRELVAQLPEHLRVVARLIERMTIAEAARALGIPRTTLNDRLRALRQAFARQGLRNYLR